MKSLATAEPAQSLHIPVMVPEVLSLLPERSSLHVVDATLGEGGHSYAIYQKLAADSMLLSLEVDEDALASVQSRYQAYLGGRWQVVHSSYTNMATIIKEQGWDGVDFVLFDLGISSRHVNDLSRGFSFKSGQVDMRMDQDLTVTAADLLNVLPVHQIAFVLEEYADYGKKQALALAKAIEQYRKQKPFGAADDSKRLQSLAKKYSTRRPHHPGTILFQALRIAVNNEFGNIQLGLQAAWDSLLVNGLIVVLSYHSGEHKLVESFFQKHSDQAEVHDQPQLPMARETLENRRSRSAQLRWLRKTS